MNFIDDCLFITWFWLLIKSFGNTSNKSSLLLALWKIENFVFWYFKRATEKQLSKYPITVRKKEQYHNSINLKSEIKIKIL